MARTISVMSAAAILSVLVVVKVRADCLSPLLLVPSICTRTVLGPCVSTGGGNWDKDSPLKQVAPTMQDCIQQANVSRADFALVSFQSNIASDYV